MNRREKRPAILLADDERGTREVLAKFLRMQYDVTLAEDGGIALNLLERNNYDLVLTDIRMPGADGLAVLRKTLEKDPAPPCILFTAYGSIETAVDAMRKGAFDFVTKPVNFDQLEIVIARALETGRMKQENTELKKRLDDKFGLKGIVGSSPAMRHVIDTVRQVAPAQLEKFEKIKKINGSYDYLLAMSISSLGFEKMEELKKLIEDGKEEYKKTKDTTIQDMWLADLKELQKCL